VNGGRAEVIVVDNGSTDGSADAARASAPWATVIEPGRNLGFGAAVNLVAKQAGGDWIAAANADVALEPGALSALLASGADARVGTVAPRLILPSGDTQYSVGPFPTVPLALLFNLGLHHLSSRLADRLCLEGHWNPERPREVPWAIGAFLLLRRRAFESVGGFDEQQWMYAEDLDLCWRLARAGWVTRYEPGALALHAAGASTAVAFGPDRVETFMRATYRVLLRRRGRVRTWTTAAINVLGAAARLAWMTPLASFSPRWRERRYTMKRWLVAHAQGLLPPAALMREK
jgi:N-acetylglucosaminyl-diphospho-decaprenol L-rhamnosyltransferase